MAKQSDQRTNSDKVPGKVLYIPDWQPRGKSNPKTWFLTFSKAIWRSITDLNYYVDILNAPVKFSVKVAIVFYLFLSLVVTARYAVVTLPQLHDRVDLTTNTIQQQLPAELTASWDGSQLTTDPEIWQIDYPEYEQDDGIMVDNLVIVDTSSDIEPDNLSTLLYFNKNKFYVNTLSGYWSNAELNSLFEVDNFTENRQGVSNWVNELSSMMHDGVNLSPLAIFAAVGFGLTFIRLILLTIDAFILQIIFNLLGKPIKFWKVYQLGLHLLIPAELISQVTGLLYPQLNIPMMGIAFWVLAVLLLWHLRNLQMVRVEFKKKQD